MTDTQLAVEGIRSLRDASNNHATLKGEAMNDTQFTVEDIRSLRDAYKPDPDSNLDQAVLKRIDGLIAALASVGENAVRVPYAWITEAVKRNLNQRGFRVFPQGHTHDDTMGVSWASWENPPEVIKERLALVKANIWDLLHEPVQAVVSLLLSGNTFYVCRYNEVKAHDLGATHWQPDLLYHTPKCKMAEHMRLSALGWANLAVRAAIARDVWEGCCGPDFIEAVKEALLRQRLSREMHMPHSLEQAQEPQEQYALLGHKGEVVGSCGPTLVDTDAMRKDLKEKGTLALPAPDETPAQDPQKEQPGFMSDTQSEDRLHRVVPPQA